MRRNLGILMVVGLIVGLSACNNNDGEELRESTYLLHRVGATPINGIVTFTELSPERVQVDISLENTVEGIPFPAHLHFGTIGETGELAFRLNDVEGASGSSTTILDKAELSNGEVFTYELLETLNGSVKIHLNDSYFKNVAIASGNIGTNSNSAKGGISICTGH